MKRTLFFLCSFVMALLSNGQGSTKLDRDKLIPLKWLIDTRPFDRTRWDLYSKFNKAEYAPTKTENMSVYTTDWITRSQMDTSWGGNRAEIPYLQKHLMPLARMFDAMTLIGPESGALDRNKEDSPVNFALSNDTNITLVIRGIHLEVVYNTLKLTSRQRATKALTTYIIPSLHKITENFTAQEVPYLAISATYGSKDALDKSVLGLKSEVLMVIIPTVKAAAFANGSLTEDELVDGMEIYLCDRDMITEMKRVKLTLE